MQYHRFAAASVGGIAAVAVSLFFAPYAVDAASYSVLQRRQIDGAFVTQTLTKDKSPYYIPGGCNSTLLPRGQTLTIQAGVVVKFGAAERCGLSGSPMGQLLVYGNLDVRGTASDPAIFTSWHDDSVGGDTNGNGNATMPQPGDWLRVQMGELNEAHTQTLSLQYLTIRYAQSPLQIYPSVDMFGPLVGLDIAHNIFYGVNTYVSTTIRNSRLYDNGQGAINAVQPGFPNRTVDARNNWWGDDSGPTVASNPGGRGQKIFGDVLYNPWIGKAPTHNPVILIPGILGSEMKRGSETLWLDLLRVVGDHGDEFLDPLALNVNGTASDTTVAVGDVIRKKEIVPRIAFDYFSGLIDEFKNKGYTEGVDLFVFPYDWRMSIESNSEKLKIKIDAALAQTRAQKVDMMAHSMGGLVAKRYLYDHPEGKVDTAVFLGVPQLGAPKATKALLFGESFDIPFLNEGEMKKLAGNMPSAYELLPGREYISQIGAYIQDFGDALNYDDTTEFLAEKGARADLVAVSDAFHSSALDSFVPAGVNAYTIAGCNKSTIGTIGRRNVESTDVPWYTYTEYYVAPTKGDGTVPLESADAMNVPNKNRYYFTKAEHSKMPSQDGARQMIAQIISGAVSSSLPAGMTQDKSACRLRGRMVSVHSPVDIHVYDGAGNHVGKNSNMTDIELNIPEVSYEELDGNKFVFLPDGQAFDVRLEGTGDGVFQMRVADIDDTQTLGTVYYNDVPVEAGQKGTLALGVSLSDTTLRLDSGSGTMAVIQKSATLNGDQSGDVEKPVTTVLVNSAPVGTQWYKSPVISFFATDENSGVLKTEYSTDNGATWQVYGAPFALSQEGAVTILYFSTDRAGNREDVRSATIKADNTAPEATFTFRSKSSYDMVVGGTDELSGVVVWNHGEYYTITDEAGNETRVYVTRSFSGLNAGARVTKITQNGVQVFGGSGSYIRYNWSVDSAWRITLLQQTVVKDGLNVVTTMYKRSTGVTTVRKGSAAQSTILPGMAILSVQTKKSSILYHF